MRTFLEQLAEAILKEHGPSLRNVAVVLPSQRAGLYLREALARQAGKALWSPELFTLSAFMERLSGLRVLPMEELLFEAYEAYRAVEGAAARPLDDFMEWAPVSLADMSEADSNMVRLDGFYRDLRSWEEIDWSFNKDPLSEGQQHMQRYWALAGRMHIALNERLITRNAGTSGLAARKAVEAAVDGTGWERIWFAGLNAFTAAEQRVVDRYHEQGLARFAWDADRYYLDGLEQEAGHHLRIAIERYGAGTIPVGNSLRDPGPHIEVVRAPNAVAQAYCAAGRSRSRTAEERAHTAIVLADESLLFTLLEVLPADLGPVNVTMGLSLSALPVGSMLGLFFRTYASANTASAWPVDGVVDLLRHPLLRPAGASSTLDEVIEAIRDTQRPRLGSEALLALLGGLDEGVVRNAAIVLAAPEEVGMNERIVALLAWAKSCAVDDVLGIEQLHQASVVLGRTAALLEKYGHALNANAWTAVMTRLLRAARIGLFGEPLAGLQVMGLLEARGLDPQHVILLGAQEGKLPTSSFDRSYIPFELRRAYGLPMRDSGDAVQAYNFLRSIQRARSVLLVYDEHGSATGPSRFIEQLRHELYTDRREHITWGIMQLPVPAAGVRPLEIPNDKETMDRITAMLGRGLSPTALRAWLRCPLDFWFRHVRGLREPDEAGVRIGGDVLGNALHGVLEDIHRPWIGRPLEAGEVEAAIPGCGEMLKARLGSQLGAGRMLSGQPLLQLGMAVRAAENFLRNEARSVRDGMHMVPLALESALRAGSSVIGLPEGVKVNIQGRLDRVDERDGVVHILDLKTGRVDDAALGIRELSLAELRGERGYAAQLLVYAWLYLTLHPGTQEVRTGLQPLQRSSGSEGVYLRIGDRDRITRSDLTGISALIAEVVRTWLDPATRFRHDPESKYCAFCVQQS